MKTTHKLLVENYKKFLIELIKNDEYTKSTYDVDNKSYEIHYKVDGDIVFVTINFRKNYIRVTSDIAMDVKYRIFNSIFDAFTKTNFGLYNQLQSLVKIARNNEMNDMVNNNNKLIPIKYQRLVKINKLKS